MVGKKLADGLLAYALRVDTPADEWLEKMGYQPKVAASICERLVDRGFVECGVSARTGWLTEKGLKELHALSR